MIANMADIHLALPGTTAAAHAFGNINFYTDDSNLGEEAIDGAQWAKKAAKRTVKENARADNKKQDQELCGE